MADITDLAEVRFNRNIHAGTSDPVDMLRAVIARIERGDLNPKHMIVAYVHQSEDRLHTGYTQSGDHDPYAAMGLLYAVAHMMDTP
jgi:hypothetical protein